MTRECLLPQTARSSLPLQIVRGRHAELEQRILLPVPLKGGQHPHAVDGEGERAGDKVGDRLIGPRRHLVGEN